MTYPPPAHQPGDQPTPPGPPAPGPYGGYGAGPYPPPGGQLPPTMAFPAYPTTGWTAPTHPAPGQQPATGPGQPPGPPRRGNGPLITVIVVAALLLCGGIGVAGYLLVRQAAEAVTEAARDAGLDGGPTVAPTGPTAEPAPGGPQPSRPRPTPTGGTVTVVYEVTGDDPIDIIYVDGSVGSVKNVRRAKVPWRLEFTGDATQFVSVTAIHSGSARGKVTCRALVDGVEVARRDADGYFAVATCSRLRLPDEPGRNPLAPTGLPARWEGTP